MTTTRTIRRHDRDRVAVLELDHPERSMNVVDEQVLGDLAAVVDEVLADDDVDALVLTSGKDGSFGAGADVAWLPELAAREDAGDFLAWVHDLMVRLVRSPKPMVTALNGPAFGGALELALGGAAIIATPTASLGLPEVTLGLVPGGGGTQLLGRFVSIATAAELLTAGTRLDAEAAQACGLVDRVVADEELLGVATATALQLATDHDRPTDPQHDAVQARQAVADRRAALSAGRGGLSAAAGRILDVLEAGIDGGLEAGLAAERESFLALVRSPESRAALHLFQAEGDVKRRSRGTGPDVQRIGVVGAGQMGSGIAATAVSRGLPAIVRDVSAESVERAREFTDTVLARSAPADGEDPRTALWGGTTGWGGFALADAVVEAVFELPEVKTATLSELCEVLPETSLVATNTSAIEIASLAPAVTSPDRFLGMHFFSPVERMPLVELIPHAGTSAETLQRAASLGRQLGKVPVVVGDAPGFFTSRVYARWLIEGVRLLLDGAAPADVDAAAKDVGFPVGPLLAHDEATLNLVVQASITQVAENVMADRLDVASVRRALESLIAAGVEGRRHGLGFYRYEDGKRVGVNEGVPGLLSVSSAGIGTTEIGERLLLAFASECFLCWDDGTLCHPDDGDVAAVLGIGFPRTLGGPFHWADEQGAAHVIERGAALGAEAFPAGEALQRMAAEGGRFTDEPRRPAPFRDPGSG